jgi:formate hydrogenlyase subunit 6/NADH:ubiquinone oxidoreductase subunit I
MHGVISSVNFERLAKEKFLIIERIKEFWYTVATIWQGMRLTLQHVTSFGRKRRIQDIQQPSYFSDSTGSITVEYPYESIPTPDHGRYRLHNEIEDCIVCDKCAKVCPVDCIEIEPIKSEGEIRKTSDGSSVRLYAAKFDIDMAKCCFCGLCTTVCPTECLTMTPSHDFSEFDVRDMVYRFSDLNAEKVEILKAKEEERQKAKQMKTAESKPTSLPTEPSESPKPAFKPVFKPKPPTGSIPT